MTFFIAGLEHETNSFSPISTDISSYEQMILYRPSCGGVIDAYDRIADFEHVAEERGYRVIRGLSALAQPGGPTRREDYEALRDEILHDLQTAFPVDAVLLVLHGAQMAVGYDDCEGDLVRAARQIVGADIPIGLQLDLHGNLTDLMIDNADFLIACKEYPHTDYRDRAAELIDLCRRFAEGEIKPAHSVFRVPMLGVFRTTESPLRELVDTTIELESQGQALSISLMHGFPWSDMEDSGAAVLVTTNASRQIGDRIAADLGRRFFAMRKKFADSYLTIDQAIDRFQKNTIGTTIIADVSDNPGGGAGGDSTYLLGKIFERGIQNAALAMIYDPEAVIAARCAGVGKTVALRIGGKLSEMSGRPLPIEARVLAIKDDARQQGLGPQLEPLGAAVAIEANGVQVVVNSRRQQTFSPDCFTQLGIDPTTKRLLVVKSSHHFYDQFRALVNDIIYCEAPGTVNPVLNDLPYRKIRHPIWPLEETSL